MYLSMAIRGSSEAWSTASLGLLILPALGSVVRMQVGTRSRCGTQDNVTPSCLSLAIPLMFGVRTN